MKYLHRVLEGTLNKYLKSFCAVGITGPRQSGKSTTLKHVLGKDYEYISFDDPFLIEYFNRDPRGFFQRYSNRIIIDEVQKAPQIFNYLKMAIDNDRDNYGKYVITGSSQFTLIKHVSETLAGRIGLLSLLPFQTDEMPVKLRPGQILSGSYPELVNRGYYNSREWYAAYISNYIERDVRSLYNIGNLRDFQRLVLLLAARTAQELNMSRLAAEVGVSVKTIQNWLSVLEASYIIFMLPAYHNNLGKRIVKRPKLYFYDTGIVCYLTGITSAEILNKGPLSGPIFENLIVSEVKKIITHKNLNTAMFYFRSNLGIEADLILEDKDKNNLMYAEIKNTHTINYKMVENIVQLIGLDNKSSHILPFKFSGHLIYRGNKSETLKDNIASINYNDFLKSL